MSVNAGSGNEKIDKLFLDIISKKEKDRIDVFKRHWLWTGAVDRGGSPKKSGARVIRTMFEYYCYKVIIPEGATIVSTCGEPLCVNPFHAEVK